VATANPVTTNPDISSSSDEGWKKVTNRRNKQQPQGQKEAVSTPPVSALKAKPLAGSSIHYAAEDQICKIPENDGNSMALVVSNLMMLRQHCLLRKTRRIMQVLSVVVTVRKGIQSLLRQATRMHPNLALRLLPSRSSPLRLLLWPLPQVLRIRGRARGGPPDDGNAALSPVF